MPGRKRVGGHAQRARLEAWPRAALKRPHCVRHASRRCPRSRRGHLLVRKCCPALGALPLPEGGRVGVRGLGSIEGPYPLTPALSPWEREPTALVDRVSAFHPRWVGYAGGQLSMRTGQARVLSSIHLDG